MLIRIAWRNIWRSPMRSLVVMTAIALGIWAAFFMSGFASGMVRSYINNAVNNVTSHLQVHRAEFKEDYEAKYFIPEPEAVEERIIRTPFVEAVSARAVVRGMISSSRSSRGVQVNGVRPEKEAAVTGLAANVVAGEYFRDDRKNQLLISRRLAEKMQVKVRSKVVITFQDLGRDITAGAFRVVGLFDTGNGPFDESNVFVRRNDLDRLLRPSDTTFAGTGELIAHEFAVMLTDQEKVQESKGYMVDYLPELLVETYGEISPDLRLYETQFKLINNIYLFIIMLALIFGIINTMLMSVLERVRELGMLMAIGMNKFRVFFMIVLETVLLSMAGLPLGLLLGHFTVSYFGTYGLSLSMYAETLEQYGMSEMVYFELDPNLYWIYPVAMAATAILASLYPALKAIRLRPVEAIRKI